MKKEIKSCMVSVASFELSDTEKYLLNKHNPLGVTLFARNIDTPEQTKNLILSIKDVLERDDVIVAIDQEGGRVARLKSPYFRDYLSQKSLGSFLSLKDQIKATKLQAMLISNDLLSLGFNLNYAPCADILFQKTDNVLKTRCFSSDERVVSRLAEEMMTVYIKNNIVPCLKHVPGHGRITLDPHLELPYLDASFEKLKKDFYPFKMLSQKTPMMMTAHIVLSQLDNKPVTQSKKVIQNVIRKEIGFDGFLITDALDMKALNGSLSEKVISSLNAGCDGVCFCMGDTSGLTEVLENTPVMTDVSLERFEKVRKIILSDNVKKKITDSDIKEYTDLKEKAFVFQEDYDAVETLHLLQTKN